MKLPAVPVTSFHDATLNMEQLQARGILDLGIPWVDVTSKGAKCNGVADDTTPVKEAFAAAPNGGSVFFPGPSRVTSTVTVNQAVTAIGSGVGSGLVLDVGSGNDGLVIASTGGGQLLTAVKLRDFAITGAANCCRNALVLRDLFMPIVEGVYIKAGAASYAASIAGVLDGHLQLFTGSNLSLPGTTAAPANGINIIGSASFPSNANRLRVYVGGVAGKGLFVDGSTGTAGTFDNAISGTVEGCTGLGVHIKNSQNWHLHDLHVEGTGTGNGITLDTSPNGSIGPGVLAGNSGGQNPLTLIASTGIEIDGSQLGAATIDASSSIRAGQQAIFTGSVSVSAGGFYTNALRSPAVSQPARALGTAYQPSTTRDVLVTAVVLVTGGGAGGQVLAYCDGANPPTTQRGQFELPASNGNGTITFMVPAGQFYMFTQAAGTVVLNIVTEYQL